MRDMLTEQTFQISDAKEHVGYSSQSVRRWVRDGRRGVDGRIHILESYMNPAGRRCTSVEAIARFTMRLNGVEPCLSGANASDVGTRSSGTSTTPTAASTVKIVG